MKTIVVDGDNFSNLAGFYDEIERKFTDFSNQEMGRNLNAFNDVMYGGFVVTEYEEPIKIIWEHSEKSKSDLGYQAQAQAYKPDESQKARINQFNPDAFSSMQQNYEQAMRHEGSTLFEDIVEIIEKHRDHIQLELQ